MEAKLAKNNSRNTGLICYKKVSVHQGPTKVKEIGNLNKFIKFILKNALIQVIINPCPQSSL